MTVSLAFIPMSLMSQERISLPLPNPMDVFNEKPSKDMIDYEWLTTAYQIGPGPTFFRFKVMPPPELSDHKITVHFELINSASGASFVNDVREISEEALDGIVTLEVIPIKEKSEDTLIANEILFKNGDNVKSVPIKSVFTFKTF